MTSLEPVFSPRHEPDLLHQLVRELRHVPSLAVALAVVLNRLAAQSGLRRMAVLLSEPDVEGKRLSIETTSPTSMLDGEAELIAHDPQVRETVLRSGALYITPHEAAAGSTPTTSPAVELSHMCVPIASETRRYGALSAHRPHRGDHVLQNDARWLSQLASTIADIVELRALAGSAQMVSLSTSSGAPFYPADLIGNSRPLLALFELAAGLAANDEPVLLLGEPGTGKARLAAAIHHNSSRAAKPMVSVSCSSLPPAIADRELFGERTELGTGSTGHRPGRFTLARSGTLILDDVERLPLSVQAQLAHILDNAGTTPTARLPPNRFDVRVIATTTRELSDLVGAGFFSETLLQRLYGAALRVPPLRERRSDILLLTDYFVERFAAIHHKHVTRVSSPAIDALVSYHWPGNVRELESCIERGVLLTREAVIRTRHLPPTVQTSASGFVPSGTLTQMLELVEEELLVEALKEARGNLAAVARKLGITERVVGLRVRKYGLDVRRFKLHGRSMAGEYPPYDTG